MPQTERRHGSQQRRIPGNPGEAQLERTGTHLLLRVLEH